MTAPLNRDRFNKLIALAESDQDGEVLSAIRKAAAMARAAGLSLGEAVSIESDKSDFGSLAIREAMLSLELGQARALISELQRKLSSGAKQDQLDNAHAEGYQRGHKAGKAEAEREAWLEANKRIRDVEAELEAYKPSMDWVAIAERFAFKNQRGPRSPFAQGVLFRARTNRLTPTDQAELRKFAEPPKRGRKVTL